MSAGTPEDEGFLSRWSRRKRDGGRRDARPTDLLSPHPEELRSSVSKDAPDGSGASGSILRDAIPAGMAPQDEGSRGIIEGAPNTEPGAEMVEPPSLDLIDKDFNVAHWLKQNVPETWKLAALRRAWESDPAIAGFENPARDYALDWNTPGGAPGYGPLTESDDVGAMVRKIFGEAPEPETPAIAAGDEASDAMSHQLSSYDESVKSDAAAQEDGASQAELAAVRLSGDDETSVNTGSIAPQAPPPVYAAVQNSPESRDASLRIRKRGGGAIPV